MKKNLFISSHNAINKKNIAKSISIIFDTKNAISDYIKSRLLLQLLWTTTEHNNIGNGIKYLGQPYWSRGALKQLVYNKEVKIKKSERLKDLRHEHSIPKKIIRDLILCSDFKEISIFEILNKYGHAVVISKEENKLLDQKKLRSKLAMPLEKINTMNDVFSRYKEAGIEICDLSKSSVLELTKTDIDKLDSLT